ncbi:hypothetical protein KJ564_07035 [bacterium]|nr:hypothetical protein [bacterium]
MKDKNLKVFRFAPLFFMVAKNSLLSSTIHHIYKIVIDKRHFGIHKYLDFIEKNDFLFTRAENQDIKELVADDRLKLIELKPLLDNVKKLRHNYHAHLNDKAVHEVAKLSNTYPLDRSSVIQLESSIHDIFNRYSQYFDGQSFALNSWSVDDFYRVNNLINEKLGTVNH